MKDSHNTIIIGRNPVYEAIVSGKQLEKVYIHDELRGEYEKKIRQATKEAMIPLVKVPNEKLHKIGNTKNHQGIVAIDSPIVYQNLTDVIAHVFDRGENPLIIVLEGVSDVRNMAAISRSALVMGAHTVVTTIKHTAQVNEDAVKISAGAILSIPICREKNMIEVLKILKLNGIKIYATDLKGASPINDVDMTSPIAIIMGDEHHGVTPETLRECDANIIIPQATTFDSLNVSVAAGIVLYEIYLQRHKV